MRLALSLLFLSAHAFAAKVVIGPYVQDVRPDSFVVAFETDVEASAAVEVGANRVSTHGKRHEARVGNLKPGGRYKYRLLVDDVESGGGEVLTAPPPDSDRPFTFLVYGDTRDGGEEEHKIAMSMLAENADFALHTGDYARNGADDESWASFFHNEAALLASLPVYGSLGNHELYKDEAADHFKRFFVLPDEGRTRHYYRWRWGRAVEIVALDGNGSFDEQTRWLRDGLRKAEMDGVKHVFIFLHQPPFSTGGHCGAAVQEQDWVELFEKHRIVRAVFGGHDHCYQRLERNGVRYFVSGGGGTRVYPEATACPSFDYAARKVYAAQHHYIRVKVKGDEIDITAVPIDQQGGAPIDAVHFSAKQLLAGGEAPPLVDDRLFGGVPRNYVLYGAGFGLLLILGGFLRRKRS